MSVCPFSFSNTTNVNQNTYPCVKHCALYDSSTNKCSIKLIAENLKHPSKKEVLQKTK